MGRDILLSFIPIFVAVDAVGVLPIFVSLVEGIEPRQRTKIIIQSMLTALCLAVGFIFLISTPGLVKPCLAKFLPG